MSASYTSVHAAYHAHKLTLSGVGEDAFAKSLTSARVEMNPHQVDAALFALKSPLARGVVLADEVGLGKTIEAGLVISQRWAEHRRRLLLIVPASLRKQWQGELREKFSLPSVILEAATFREAVKAGRPRPFEQEGAVVIASYEFAAHRSAEIRAVRWDLVVIDEAHRLRNVWRDGPSRAKLLRDALSDRFKILLTATPLQNSLMELYGIVSVIDDTHFGGKAAFKERYATGGAAALDALRDRLRPVCHRTLRSQVQRAGHINFRRREARTFTFEPNDLEVALYEGLSDYLKRPDTVAYGGAPNQLVILQARKILGSSSFAIGQYLETVLARLRKAERATVSMTDDVEAVLTDAEDEDDDADGDAEPVDPAKLAAEIAEVTALRDLARSIGSNAKGEMLAAQLPHVLDQIEAKGGARKAVIFTESVRTQRYVHDLLSANGYEGRIVLLNGSNADDASRAILADWRRRHAGTDRLSGSRSADMKAALVEAFRSDDKTILIATESGAEGINLQFCSLVINYDLPWNPQRVEQRIGRCHRYGQKIDVTVVSMLNLKNQTEARIHQLLSDKFHLFDGVFGASDEVLGTLMSGLDFEKEVLRIVQNCRTEAEAEAEFAALTASIQDRIDADMLSARARVLEAMDGEVVARLQRRGEALAAFVPEFRQRLLMVARAELPDAVFPSRESTCFNWQGRSYTTEWSLADARDWQFFRVNDGLGFEVVERARAAAPAAASVVFHPDAYPYGGRLAAADMLRGRSGWLRVTRAAMPTGDSVREELLIACLDDEGDAIDPKVADKLLLAPGVVQGGAPMPPAVLDALAEAERARFGERVKAENFAWVQAEEERLDQYVRDLEIEMDAAIAELETAVRDMRREQRSADLSMEAKLDMSRRIKRTEAEMDELKMEKFERRRKARREVEDKLDAFADSLRTMAEFTHVLDLRWSVA